METERATMNRKPVFTVPGKGIINFKSGFKEKLLCDGLTFSTGSACAYSCEFCYVESMMHKNPHWQAIKAQAPEGKFENVVIRRSGAIKAMRQQLLTRGKPRFLDDKADRRVIYASPLVDVAANMDLVRETVEACKLILELTNWQIRLLSKSNLLPKIAEMLGRHAGAPQRVIYGVSTGTLNDALAASFETGTPRVSRRIEALHWLQDHGYRTFGMICPSLPQRFYRNFAEDMAAAIRWDNCEHVWAEVINVRGQSMKRTCAALRKGGFEWEAASLENVAENKTEWELYARNTFEAHAGVYGYSQKLRFLQYVNEANRLYWTHMIELGAVLL